MDATTVTPPLPSAAELDALRRAIGADLPAYLEDLAELVNIDCGSYTRAGVDEVGRWVAAFLGELGATVEARPDPAGRLGDTIVATFEGLAERSAGAAHRAHGHGLRSGDRGRAPVPHRGRGRLRPGRDRHEVGAAGRALRAQGDRRGARRPPLRAARLHRQPRRGDRLADIDAAHRGDRGRLRRRARPRMRPCERRHRLGAQGHPRPAHRRPRPGGARRRRAREGSQRDPRGGPDRARAARPERPLAGRHRQRRAHPRRDATERGRRDVHARGRRPGDRPRRARDRRGRDPRDRRGDRDPRRDRRLRADGALVADGEARAQRPARRARPGRGAIARLRGRRRRRPVARPTPTRRPGWASPASTASGRSVATTMRRPSTSTSIRSCRGRRCWPASCWPSPRTRRSSPGGTQTRRHERAPADLVGRAVGGRGRLQPGDRGRRFVLGRGHHRRRAGRHRRAIPATPAPRRGRSSRSSRPPWPRRASRWPTSCGRGCS